MPLSLFKYVNILLLLAIVYTLLNLFKGFKKEKIFFFLLCYCIIAFSIFSFLSYSSIKNNFNTNYNTSRKIFETGNSLFILFEILSFHYFFKRAQEFKLINKAMNIIVTIFCVALLGFVIYLPFNNSDPETITNSTILFTTIEQSILFITCLLFYYSIVQKSIKSAPIDTSTLWTSHSIFIYVSVSFPFFIISQKLRESNFVLYYIMYIGHYLSLFFLFMTLGLALKTKNKTSYD